MRNTLQDLNNSLFEQLERLQDDELNQQEFEKEIVRSKAVTGISTSIVKSADLQLKALKFKDEALNNDSILSPTLRQE